ncbi:MBL fold metallo-hydrolase [Myxococcaceae bacterium JPH2]|nr:MBL fold metallo-hydrolase [Myxococcaceae bacterium JPH2]
MTWRKRLGWSVGGLLGVLVLLVGVLAAQAWTALGSSATGARRERMERSPEWRDGHFTNPQPLINDAWGSVAGMFHPSPDVSPSTPPSTVMGNPERFATPPASGLRVTWFGHSSVLLELDGHRVLMDPMWSERASPLDWVGPRRWFPPLVPLAALPAIDAVLISHDHYDHLDRGTLVAMKDWDTRFIVPLGVGAHLSSWGIPESRIVEMDWWQSVPVGGLEVVATPARHASGRKGFDKDATLWAGYAVRGPTHRAYYSGDTGLFPAMKAIGEKLGPFDVTMIEVGQYHQAWPDWHIGPEQAVRAHQLVQGRVFLPVHWGLLGLAAHGWTEPIERALAAADKAGVTAIAPRPGQSVEPGSPPPLERWWPSLPWRTGEQDPIVSSQME